MAKANTPSDFLGVLLLGRTGQGKSTTANKLLKAGGESVLRENEIAECEVGGDGVSCTKDIRSIYRRRAGEAKAVQIVDTPGFADSNAVQSMGTYSANLAMFRDLIRRRINDRLRIHRVLYFLPRRGPLEVADAVIQEEIEVMHHFLGNAIFNCMVLVGTLHKRYQRYGFSDQDIEDTRDIFTKALNLVPMVGDRPKCPPVIFIGLEDKGVDIQRKIESAPVVSNEGLTLDTFVQGTCSLCATKYLCQEGKTDDPENRLGVLIPVQGEKNKDNKEEFIPYHSSQCHPLFMPKYSFWEKVRGGAAHTATLGIPMLIQKLRKRELPWPTFTSKDEECVECKNSPGSKGCTEVHTKYTTTLPTGEIQEITVDHTNALKDCYSKYLDETYK